METMDYEKKTTKLTILFIKEVEKNTSFGKKYLENFH